MSVLNRRRPVFTKRQIELAAEIATKHGVTVRLEVDGTITISPKSQKDLEEEMLDRELEEFELRVNRNS